MSRRRCPCSDCNRGIARAVKPLTINDEERRQWIENDEGLYLWRCRSGMGVRQFIRMHRAEIDAVIRSVIDAPPSASTWVRS